MLWKARFKAEALLSNIAQPLATRKKRLHFFVTLPEGPGVG
jgi:hypothetical protein